VAVEADDTALDRRAHEVQFYDRDEDLAEAVGRYLVDPLSSGAVAIVIATDAHHRAFDAELAAAGLDPAHLRRSGAITALDASTTLAEFMPEGRVDRALFQRVIGSTVRAAVQTGRLVVAYGEMVALLWDRGDVPAAIELEKLWNELRDLAPFTLLCGYSSASVSGRKHTEALEQVCHLHTAVHHPPLPTARSVERTLRIDPDFGAPAAARRLVADTIGEWRRHSELLEDAMLVASEMASNVVKHAGTPFSVTVRCHRSGVRISAQDASAAQPIVRDPGPEALSGRGLRLIGDIAEGWGIEWTEAGKTVWAHLRT
jgi:hypothetical protein